MIIGVFTRALAITCVFPSLISLKRCRRNQKQPAPFVRTDGLYRNHLHPSIHWSPVTTAYLSLSISSARHRPRIPCRCSSCSCNRESPANLFFQTYPHSDGK